MGVAPDVVSHEGAEGPFFTFRTTLYPIYHGCMSDASFFQQKMADANEDCSRICNFDSCKKISLMGM